jgi:glycine cleavage system aminomethyltransferase T/bacterioferritin-associated ferredoxin
MAIDSVLIHALRRGEYPSGGGTLCGAGDCPNCLATVDGVAYTRMCQTPHHDGRRVESHPPHGQLPPLESRGDRPPVAARTIHCDVVVIGQGPAGREAAEAARATGLHVVTLDSRDGQDAIGIYPGPLVVARTGDGMLHLYPRGEIIVATGAAEILPVAPGNDLRGLVTARAAAELAAAGVLLGRVASVGTPPEGVACERADGHLVRFEASAADPRHVGAVITRRSDGAETRTECDTVSLGLGLIPRDALLRMARGMHVRGVGDVLRAPDLPPCPTSGVVCACLGVTVDDLRSVYARGFRELELVKRATLAGTGPCQGAACVPHMRAFLAAQGTALQPPFTARPVTRQLTLGEAAAGMHHAATPRTALDAEHRALGAHMERLGGWWRPWHYGDTDAEYAAVRTGVSICDVSTLGKMQVSGPGAVALLEHLYPVPIASLKAGRARYVLLLDERGYVIDDGMVCRDGETRFTLTFTSGGSTFAELWVRDWAESLNLDVRLLNQTTSLGAINVTGPRATELLARAGVMTPPAFLHHSTDDVAGVHCRLFRLSFTGEVSYELHHAAADSVTLWRALLALGADLGVRPHGLEALMRLRLEKGHIIVGQDTDFDSTPRRLNHEWAARLDKPAFVGRQAVIRTNALPLDRRLCGLTMDGTAPAEGATIWSGGEFAGYVTSSTWSPTLQRSVLLGWLRLSDGALPETVTIDGRPARRVQTPFYDPEGTRARA